MRRLMRLAVVCVVGLGALCVGRAVVDERVGYIDGLVYDVDGIPVMEALVLALGVTSDGLILEQEGTVGSDVTDSIGSYELSVLPGSYEITVKADGYVAATIDLEVYEGMTLAEPVILLRAAEIHGTVFGGDGSTPIPDAVVWAAASDGPLHTSQADADGVFSLTGLPAGEYSLSALAGSESAIVDGVAVAAGETIGEIRVVLSPLPFTASPDPDGGAISGYVLQPDGETPVPGARIVLVTADGDAVERAFEPTDGAGAFVAEGLAEGIYDIIASAAGFASAYFRGVGVSASALTEDVEIVLPLPYGYLHGDVVAVNGTPISEALVIAAGDGWSHSTISDSAGAFVLPYLPEGAAVISAIAEGYEVAILEVVVVAPSDSETAVVLVLAVEGGS